MSTSIIITSIILYEQITLIHKIHLGISVLNKVVE